MTQIEILKWSNRLGALIMILGLILFNHYPIAAGIGLLSGIVLFMGTALLLSLKGVRR